MSILFKRLSVITAIIAVFSISASAQREVVEIGLNQKVSLDFTQPVYKFIPGQSGLLHVETDDFMILRDAYNSTFFFFTDEECSKALPLFCPPLDDSGRGFTYVFEVEKGKPYYLYADIVLPIYLTLTMGHEELTMGIKYLNPECGENVIYPILGHPVLEIEFNHFDVDCDGGYLVYQTLEGEKRKELYMEASFIDQTWMIYMWDAFQAVKNEIIKDSQIRVEIINPNCFGVPVEGNYIENGNIVLRYRYLPLTNLISESWPKTFLSYWPADEPVQAVITFDAPLSPEQPLLTYAIYGGNDRVSENGMPVLAAPEFKIEGNSIIMNFEGVRRDCNYDLVSIFVQDIVDSNGMAVNYRGSSSIFKEIPYILLEKIDPVFEWTPGTDAKLNGHSEIEFWIQNACFDHMLVKGFEFKTESDITIVSLDECEIMPDPLSPDIATIYTIPVPESVMNSTSVEVNPILRILDGYDYDLGVRYSNAISGIPGCISIGSQEHSYKVFNLQGIQILSTESKEDVKSLPHGLYIVNGKKIIL